MIDTLLSKVAPYPCVSCDDLNGPLCDNCKYNIVSEPFVGCVACGSGVSQHGVCDRCRVPYLQAWCVGRRSDELELLIDRYKFYRLKSAAESLALMLAEILPVLPSGTVVVPVPTIRRHVRQRGYDHVELLARRVARLKHVEYRSHIHRKTQAVQHNSTRAERIKQAKIAFGVDDTLDPTVPYLVIDDIVTTGSTVKYAAKALRDAGAREVWVAAIARQGSTK